MPLLGESKYGGWLVGKPGMIASHSYKHSRQSITDSFWVNKTAKNLKFGTGVVRSTANKIIDSASVAGDFVGVLQDPEKYLDRDYYAPRDKITVVTMGDIWVLVDPAITIVELDPVYCINTAGATEGFFTNVASTNIEVSAKFQSGNMNGIAIISIFAN